MTAVLQVNEGKRLLRWLLLGGSLWWGIPFAVLAQTAPPIPPPAVIEAAPVKPDTTDPKKFLQTLRRISQRKTIFGRAVRALVVFKPRSVQGPIDAEVLPQDHDQHNYKVVRRIYYKRMEPFGYSIHDTLKLPDNYFENLGNAVHMRTKKGRISNTVLFREGELLEPLALSESERLLRQTPYILDARILVNDSTSTADSLDIVIITRDVFSISASGSASTSGTRLSLRTTNFMGIGHQVRTTYRFGLDQPQPWQFQGSYFIENISSSYISAELMYENTYAYNQQSLAFRRDFFATTTKYAGGALVGWFQTLQPNYYLEEPPTPEVELRLTPIEFNIQDIWVGRSFELKSYDLAQDNPSRLITAGRFVNTKYTRDSNHPILQSARLYLGAVGLSTRRYYKDQYLFGFGRTEDVPTGNMLALTTGYEDGSRKNRFYLGAKGALGTYSSNFGYLYAGVEYGSYLYHNNWEQGVFTSEALYFTRLYRLGNWRVRQFIWNRTSLGLRRPDLFALNIDNSEGIRGFRSASLRGYRKFVLNYEANLFTPLTLFGFRFAVIGFADLAWITSVSGRSPFEEKPFQGFGAGLRFRNEYLPFRTIQVLFGYYPRVPHLDGREDLKLFQTTRQYYEFNDLRFTQPLITEFR